MRMPEWMPHTRPPWTNCTNSRPPPRREQVEDLKARIGAVGAAMDQFRRSILDEVAESRKSISARVCVRHTPCLAHMSARIRPFAARGGQPSMPLPWCCAAPVGGFLFLHHSFVHQSCCCMTLKGSRRPSFQFAPISKNGQMKFSERLGFSYIFGGGERCDPVGFERSRFRSGAPVFHPAPIANRPA